MGSNGARGGRTDAGANRTTAQRYTKPQKNKFGYTVTKGNYQTINEKGKVVGSSFISEGANKSNRDIDKLPLSGTKVIGTLFKGPLAKGAKFNRKSFENQVVGNTKKGAIRIDRKEWDSMSNTKKESIYGDYIKSRQSGKTDYYGRNITGGGDGKIIQPTITSPTTLAKADAIANSPTTAEVSQSSAIDAAPYDLRKTKAKGRSRTILTSSKGVQQDDKLTLGKKSLLGA